MNQDELEELQHLDTAERAGKVLTGSERGRLADLRRAEILATVAGLLTPITPPIPDREIH